MAPMASFTACICAAACPMAMAAKSVAFLFFSTSAFNSRSGIAIILSSRAAAMRSSCAGFRSVLWFMVRNRQLEAVLTAGG